MVLFGNVNYSVRHSTMMILEGLIVKLAHPVAADTIKWSKVYRRASYVHPDSVNNMKPMARNALMEFRPSQRLANRRKAMGLYLENRKSPGECDGPTATLEFGWDWCSHATKGQIRSLLQLQQQFHAGGSQCLLNRVIINHILLLI
jgi:hypothetical protein